ncbi:FMRFamide receptor [Biomphalaria pfeifferi]|uniref:FMRFamide receptor n=1 Tax=Biomphalaria pfeifferi TaxID=112525 RepID=A0AAD8F362_BIOPF|nr:FMRFamide receptor [Biomphalaria pfeifferi]
MSSLEVTLLEENLEKEELLYTSSHDDMILPSNLNFATSAIVGPILCIFGLVGNALSLSVWSKASMRCSTAIYLSGQAVADLGVLLAFMFSDSIQAWAPEVKYSLAYGVFYSYLAYPFLFTIVVLSIWITVGVTLDRYIMVCWITKAKIICSERHTKLVLVVTTLCATIVNIPNFLFYTPVYSNSEIHSNNSVGRGERVPGIEPRMSYELSEFGSSPGGVFFEFWIHCIIVLLVPWMVVLVLNLLIIRKIVKTNKRMKDKKTASSSEKSRQSENQITRLLLTVTFSFLFFMGFQCIIQCIYMQRPAEAHWPTVVSSFAVGKIGIVFTSSSNFVFYCMTGRKFRKELFIMFGIESRYVLSSSTRRLTMSDSSRSTSTSGI